MSALGGHARRWAAGWAPRTPRVAFLFSIADGRIRRVGILADPQRLRRLDQVILDP